jgi:chaperonin GroEL (HSP60 family)
MMESICNAPYKQICENAGVTVMDVPRTVIDSFKTVKHSLLNALSTATSILMTESALIEEKENDD